MSFLNRSEDATVPSCPPSDTTTGAVVPLTVVRPKMFSIQVVPLTLSPALSRQITVSAVVTLSPAKGPKATLEKPLVLFLSAAARQRYFRCRWYCQQVRPDQLPYLGCRSCCW